MTGSGADNNDRWWGGSSNLHIMLRFDLENKLLDGKLSVNDLPEAWRERCKPILASSHPMIATVVCRMRTGIPVTSAVDSRATRSAIFYPRSSTAALKAHPNIPREIASGEFGTLHTWLRDNPCRHGSKFVPNDLVERATGAVMQMRRRSPRSECTSGRNDRAPPGLWRAVGENAGRANRQRS
jgi:carboxypeptidase Taq